MNKIDFRKIENIEVDLILSLGINCRPAGNLRRNGLRLYSSPFDWQMCYSLETVTTLLKNNGKSFFSDCCEDEITSSTAVHRKMIDKSGMISIHDFPKVLPVEKAPAFFHKKYKYRFKTLNLLLKKAKKILIITYRNINNKEIEKFVKDFSELYKYEHLYFINIYDTKDSTRESVDILKKDNKTFIWFYFNDEYKSSRNKDTNPCSWLGNTEYWDEILKKVTINKKFKQKMLLNKKKFNIDYEITKDYNIRKKITILGKNIRINSNL